MKKAVLQDMTAEGKKAGLKSFEQVSRLSSDRPDSTVFVCKCYDRPLSLSLSVQVKDIHLHPETFSIANGLLTPTLKSRRADIRRVFQEQISSMYSKTPI